MQLPKEIKDRIVYKKNNTGEIQADLVFRRLLPKVDTCEVCPRKCDRARVVTHFWLESLGAWAHKCETCHKYKNPTTGKFDTTKTHCYSAIAQANRQKG